MRASAVPAKKKRDFDPRKFLATIGEGRKVVVFPRKETIFTQGDAADAVFYIQEGKVRLTVVSESGKEATLGILNQGEFFGEGALAGQPLRTGSATTMTDCEVLQIDKKAHDACAPPRIHVLRSVRGVSAGTKHPIRRGFGGPTLQFLRKETRSGSAVAGSLR